jgi:hypothetical protein
MATLPVGARPTATVRLDITVNSGVHAALEIATTGALLVADFVGTALWAALDGATFRIT